MCLIINREQGQTITKEFIENVFNRNRDGWGFMYNRPSDGKVVVKKGLKLDDFFAEFNPVQEKNLHCIIHFRMKTHGAIDMDNCHPFEVTRGVYFMHNGVIDVTTPKKDVGKASDTAIFVRDILKPLLVSVKDKSSAIRSQWFQHFMEAQADSHNSRFTIMDEEGAEFYGKWTKTTKGVWCSNTYAYSLDNPTNVAYTPPATNNHYNSNYGRGNAFLNDDDYYHSVNYTRKAGETSEEYYKRLGIIDSTSKNSVGNENKSRASDSAEKANAVYKANNVVNYNRQAGESCYAFYKRLNMNMNSHTYKVAGETVEEFRARRAGEFEAFLNLPSILDPVIVGDMAYERSSLVLKMEVDIRTDRKLAEDYLLRAKNAKKEVDSCALPFQETNPSQEKNQLGTQESSTTPHVGLPKGSGNENTKTNGQEHEKSSSNEQGEQEDDPFNGLGKHDDFIDLVDAINKDLPLADDDLVSLLEDELEEELENFRLVAEEDWLLDEYLIDELENRIIQGELRFDYSTEGKSTLSNSTGVIYPDFLATGTY